MSLETKKKHATASVFVFQKSDADWQLGVIHHPRLGWWMLPGGHVEDDETSAEAALREVAEETGYTAVLLHPAQTPLPAGFPYPSVPLPWWIIEIDVPADNHLAEPHVHIDHIYVALAGQPAGTEPAHPFRWTTATELGETTMIEDSRLQAKELFTQIDSLAQTARTAREP